MILIFHDHLASVGVAGFAGLWAAKAALSYSAFRVWKRRRARLSGAVAPDKGRHIGVPPLT